MGYKWVFKIKRGPNGEILRYKARLCAQGFCQVAGIDYGETFSPVASFKSVRTLLAIAAEQDLELSQLDVQTAFLYGKLDADVYMRVPPGVESGGPNLVCKLDKALFGLKQSPKLWNSELNATLLSLGFDRLVNDPCLYVRRHRGEVLYLAVWVDDIVVASSSEKQTRWFKDQMSKRYNMTDCGELHWCLGMRIRRDRDKGTITIDQERYIKDVLQRFRMGDCNPASIPAHPGVHLTKEMSPSTDEEIQRMKSVPYRSAVGSLMFAMVGTRPDIAAAVARVCRYMENPGEQHWAAVKQIFHYLRGHAELGLTFRRGSGLQLRGWSDADWAEDRDTRRSTTGYVFTLAGAAISWKSKLQTTPALSTTEAEYMSAGAGVQEALSLRSLLEELGHVQSGPTPLCEDNQGCIRLALNRGSSYRTRHIAIRHHFIRHYTDPALGNHTIDLTYVPTKKMVADAMTKALNTTDFRRFRDYMLGRNSK